MFRTKFSGNSMPLAFATLFLSITLVLAGFGLVQAQTYGTTQAGMFWVGTDQYGNKTANIVDYDADTGQSNGTHSFPGVAGWTPTTGSETAADQYRVVWSCTNATYCPQGMALMLTFNDQNIVTGFNVYGPYPGWTPTSYYQNPNGGGNLLWYNTDGTASLWDVDDHGNFLNYHTYGPYAGWTPSSYYGTTSGTNYMLWNNTGNGMSSLWELDGNDDYVGYNLYSAGNSGWNAYGYSQNASGAGQLLWSNNSGQASVWNLGYNNTYQGYKLYNSPYTSGDSSARSYNEYEGGGGGGS